MVKYILIGCFLLLFISIEGKCQNTSLPSDSVISELNMSAKMWKEWHTLDSSWTKNMFHACLAESGLKLNCAECEKIFMTVQMKIDSGGKLISYKKIKENMCGKNFTPQLEKCFFDFFFFIEFPADFRNTTIEVRLGDGLKC